MIRRGRLKVVTTTVIGVCVICLINIYLDNKRVTIINQPQRRKLWSLERINPVFENNIKPLDRNSIINSEDKETAIFWHIAKSGGTTVKTLYKCMRKVMTVRVGTDSKWGHDTEEELVVFEPGSTGKSRMLTVNADTLSPSGIIKAAEMGLVESHLVDIIVTTNINFAIDHLFSSEHKGIAFTLFRHPVKRLISKFYYVQTATWERSYRPEWQKMDIKYWAEHVNSENNPNVKALAKLGKNDVITEAHLRLAQRTIAHRLVVGLMDEMEESIHRFNIVLGIDETTELNRSCMDEFFGHGLKKSNSHSHPEVPEGSPAWKILAEKNVWDLKLHDFIVEQFDIQRDLFLNKDI